VSAKPFAALIPKTEIPLGGRRFEEFRVLRQLAALVIANFGGELFQVED
jgi:hypothetical protein